MRKIKKLSTAFFVLVLFLTLSAPAMAAAAIDTTHPVSLTISYQQDRKPIPGVPFALYRVADVNAYAEFTLSGDFKNYPVRLDGLDSAAWRALAETLAAYVQRDRLTPLDSGVTDRNGELTFPTNGKTLLPGLYLVIGQTFSDGSFVYTTEPFLICLPNLDEKTDTWQYDVTVSPKHTRTPIPVVPPDDTDKRKVLKVWNDAGQEHDRPEKITVQLLKNGEVYDTVILNERNSWRYIWNDLPKYDKNGDGICQYVVLEGEAGHQDAIVRTEYSVNTLVEKGVKAEKLGYAIANWKRAQAQTKMTTLLEQYGERIELILANNDDMALGSIDALKVSELPKDEWPIIVGIDGTDVGLGAIKNGEMAGTAYNDKEGQAEAMLKLAFVLSEKDPDSGLTLENIPIQDEKYVRMPYYRVTLDNVEEYVEWSKKKPDGVGTTENTEITE